MKGSGWNLGHSKPWRLHAKDKWSKRGGGGWCAGRKVIPYRSKGGVLHFKRKKIAQFRSSLIETPCTVVRMYVGYCIVFIPGTLLHYTLFICRQLVFSWGFLFFSWIISLKAASFAILTYLFAILKRRSMGNDFKMMLSCFLTLG